MDVSVLPNNNHHQKFLQLDVRTLKDAGGVFQIGAVTSSQRLWKNRRYGQPPASSLDPGVCVDRPSHVRTNPLCVDRPSQVKTNPLSNPAWTLQEYHHCSFADALKEREKTPADLDFWLEDVYTLGFDSLLKKKEAEERRRQTWKRVCVVMLSLGVVLVIVVVPLVI